MNYFNYFTEIEETFIRRRGKHLLLSPLDWALIESWQERGIPLRIVLRGIETVFDGVDKNPNHKRTIKSLMYCREEIETQYAEWRESQVGKESQKKPPKIELKESQKEKETAETSQEIKLFSDEMIQNHLTDITKKLNQSKAKSEGDLRRVLEEITKQIPKDTTNNKSVEKLENSLTKMESLIDKALLETTREELLTKFKKDVENEISKYNLNEKSDVYERTFDLMLLKKLREQSGIPRLSLFYL